MNAKLSKEESIRNKKLIKWKIDIKWKKCEK